MSIDDFFSNLSIRLYKENNLSDITWAVCQADDEFQSLFLSYCFGQENFQSVTLSREYPKESSRPDFYFKHNDIDHIIEVKIYDQNHHFKQYDKSFPNAKKAFIANYKHEPVKGYVVTDWEGFYKKIESYLQDSQNQHKLLIKGYHQYLKNVINYVRINKMNLANINSIFDFNEAIKKIINTFDPGKCRVYTSSKSHAESFSGQYFEFNINKKTSVRPWFGLHFVHKGVWIIFEKELCESVFENLKTVKKGEYHDDPEIDGDVIWFKLKDDLFSKFNLESTTLEKQKEMLKNFFDEVMNYLK
jgi:hypothetical protein